MNKEKRQVLIYTDGACLGNPGPGGYAAILKYKGKIKELSGGYKLTTNNRMELLAVINGLKTLKFACLVEVYTDSKYIANAMNDGWALRWSENNWKKKDKTKVLNPDLWKKLLDLADIHKISFKWVKAHSGHKENERCDTLAKKAIKTDNLQEDSFYIKTNSKPANTHYKG